MLIKTMFFKKSTATNENTILIRIWLIKEVGQKELFVVVSTLIALSTFIQRNRDQHNSIRKALNVMQKLLRE